MTLRHLFQFCTPLFILSAFSSAAEPELNDLLRQGLYAEEVSRDPAAAAAQYEQILARFHGQQAIAATALFRLAEVRRQQDKKADAITLYQQLLTDFPTAEAEAKLARQHLTELGGKIPEAGVAVVDEEEMEFARLKKLLVTSPDVARSETETVRAVTRNSVAAVKLLLDGGATVWDQGMVTAAKNGNLTIVNLLLDRGMNRNAGSALMAAIEWNRLEIARAIIQKVGSQAGAWGEPLAFAVKQGRVEIVRALLDAGARTDWQPPMCGIPDHPNLKVTFWEGPALITAIGNEAMTDMLLAAGADVNLAAADTGFTPLHCVGHHQADFGCRLAEKLLSRGAQVNALSKKHSTSSDDPFGSEGGVTPLDVVYAGLPETAALLVKHGAKATVNGVLRRLRPAAGTDTAEGIAHARMTLELMLSTGVDPNAVAKDGRSLLQTALDNDALSAAAVLLKAGANPNIIIRSTNLTDTRSPVTLLKHQAEGLVCNQLDPENLAKVKLLIDAGASPGADIDIPFRVGPHDLDGSVMKALLANKDLHGTLLRSLGGLPPVDGWQPAAREVFFNRVAIPGLANRKGVALLATRTGRIPETPMPGKIADDGNMAGFLDHHHLAILTANDPKGDAVARPLLTLARVGGNGSIERIPINYQGTDPLPTLKSGDVILIAPDGEPIVNDTQMAIVKGDFLNAIRKRLDPDIKMEHEEQEQ
jgi:ankyrin repeat protein